MSDRMMNWKILGERLHIARRRRGFTSAQLAQLAGTSRVTISRLENEHKPLVSLDVLWRIALVLEVSLDWLTGRKDDESVELEPTLVGTA